MSLSLWVMAVSLTVRSLPDFTNCGGTMDDRVTILERQLAEVRAEYRRDVDHVRGLLADVYRLLGEVIADSLTCR